MSLGAWKWLSGVVALLLLVCPLIYSRLVFIRAPDEGWAWLHQLVGTFFSVAFASAVAVWLYTWQTEKNSADRQMELRAAQLISIFDTWDLLGDDHLQNVELPDGSEEKVLMTFLQTTIYDESIRSGLFGTAETMALSRLSAAVHIYNGRVERLLPVLKSIEEDEDAPSKLVEKWCGELHGVQDARQLVVTAGENLMKSWTLREVQDASTLAAPDSRQESDPRVARLVEQHLPKITPAGYKAGLYTKLERVEEMATEGDYEAADGLLDEVIAEARSLSGDKISTEEAEHFIATVNKVKVSLKDLPDD